MTLAQLTYTWFFYRETLPLDTVWTNYAGCTFMAVLISLIMIPQVISDMAAKINIKTKIAKLKKFMTPKMKELYKEQAKLHGK